MTRYFPEEANGGSGLQVADYATDRPVALAGRTATTDDGSGVLVWDVANVGNAPSAERWHLIPANQRTGVIVAATLNASGDYSVDPVTGEVLDFDATLAHWIITSRELGRNLTVIRAMVAEDVGAPTVVSATVSIDDPDALVVVFSELIDVDELTGLTLSFSVGTPRTLTAISGGAGTTTVTFALSGALDGSETASLVVGAGRTAQDLAGNLVATGSTPLTLLFAPDNPLELLGSSLLTWLDAGTGVTASTTFTWADQSGNGLDFTATGGARPTASTVDGTASVHFDGAAQKLENGAMPVGEAAYEGFIVFRSAADPPDGSPASDLNGVWSFGAGSAGGVVVPYKDSPFLVFEGFCASARHDSIAGWATTSDNALTLYNARSASGAFSLHQNGTQFYTTGTNTVQMAASAAVGAGAAGSTSYLFNGHIVCVVIVKKILSSPERAALIDWINYRHGTNF